MLKKAIRIFDWVLLWCVLFFIGLAYAMLWQNHHIYSSQGGKLWLMNNVAEQLQHGGQAFLPAVLQLLKHKKQLSNV